jgi:exopolysaccharide biosynthesis protein
MRYVSKNGTFWIALAIMVWICAAEAATLIGPWTPIFKGVEYSVSSNTPSTRMPNQHVVHALRVDLGDPDIDLRTTPRVATNYSNNVREVVGLTVSDFLKKHELEVAINANFFNSPGYYPPPGTTFNMFGLAIDQGTNVSTISSAQHAATFIFDTNNAVTFFPTNFPAKPLTNAYTAVTGEIALVLNGTNRMTRDFDVQPRTVFGISEDRKYLFLIAIDGRQEPYSEGATLFEAAEWILLLGAKDGINMDGGGSTLIVIADSTGAPVRLNSSSAVVGDPSGRERVVGSHFGLHAKPLPAFINDVQVAPDDKSAVVTWTTIEPASSEVRYGLTTDFELGSVSDATLTDMHSLTLTNLTPATAYFFQITSATAQQSHNSPNFAFTTTNYVRTNVIFDVSQAWWHSSTAQETLAWTAVDYDHSGWSGPGAGVLWVDTRSTPNPNIQNKATRMQGDPTTSFPYVTYYLRTSFDVTNVVAGSALELSTYVDDGAIFYLNGERLFLLRMGEDATSSTIATGFPCAGDADCLEVYTIPASAVTNLVVGRNVLAAEVHNYNARSPDITFGVGLSVIEPIPREITLEVTRVDGKVSVHWENGILQTAPTVEGPWDEVGGTTSNPLMIEPTGTNQFYRVRQ